MFYRTLLINFIEHIQKKEDLEAFNLYVNFDKDYSQQYQKKVLKSDRLNKIDRIYKNISPKNICRGLSIK